MYNTYAVQMIGEEHRAMLQAEADHGRLAAHARRFNAAQAATSGKTATPSRLSAIVGAVRHAFGSPVAAATDGVVPALRDYPVSRQGAAI